MQCDAREFDTKVTFLLSFQNKVFAKRIMLGFLIFVCDKDIAQKYYLLPKFDLHKAF